MEMNVGYDWIGWIGTAMIIAGYYFNAKKIKTCFIRRYLCFFRRASRGGRGRAAGGRAGRAKQQRGGHERERRLEAPRRQAEGRGVRVHHEEARDAAVGGELAVQGENEDEIFLSYWAG